MRELRSSLATNIKVEEVEPPSFWSESENSWSIKQEDTIHFKLCCTFKAI